jgi:hypothetical protein
MDCLRSFTINIDLLNNVTGASNLKQWNTAGGNHYWQVTTGTSSTFNIEGFKNINVYGIDVIGSIQTDATIPNDGVIVNNWSIDVQIGGQAPQVGSSITASPNFYNITAGTNNFFALGQYTPSVKFASPFLSVPFIQFGSTFAQGIGYQTLGTVNLRMDLAFVVYYKFQEDEFAFL